MNYRQIEYSVWEKNFIKLFHKAGIKREAGSVMRNGELYVSIPEPWLRAPGAFAKDFIDKLYDTAEYHKKQELRKRLK